MTVANSSPVPIIVYNNVSVTGIDLSVSNLKKMASHPNIAGVKDKDVSLFFKKMSVDNIFNYICIPKASNFWVIECKIDFFPLNTQFNSYVFFFQFLFSSMQNY